MMLSSWRLLKMTFEIDDDYNFCNAILSLAKPHSNAKRRSSQGHKTFAARLSHYSTKFMNSKRDLKLEQGPVDPRREWIKKKLVPRRTIEKKKLFGVFANFCFRSIDEKKLILTFCRLSVFHFFSILPP